MNNYFFSNIYIDFKELNDKRYENIIKYLYLLHHIWIDLK